MPERKARPRTGEPCESGSHQDALAAFIWALFRALTSAFCESAFTSACSVPARSTMTTMGLIVVRRGGLGSSQTDLAKALPTDPRLRTPSAPGGDGVLGAGHEFRHHGGNQRAQPRSDHGRRLGICIRAQDIVASPLPRSRVGSQVPASPRLAPAEGLPTCGGG